MESFKKPFFVPLIKSKKDHRQFYSVSKNNISSIIKDISKKVDSFITCFEIYSKRKFVQNTDLKSKLESIVDFFFTKININISEIENSLFKINKLEQLEQLELKIIKKYKSNKLKEDFVFIKKNLKDIIDSIVLLHTIEHSVKNLTTQIYNTKSEISKIEQILSTSNNTLIIKGIDIETVQDKILKCELIINEPKSDISYEQINKKILKEFIQKKELELEELHIEEVRKIELELSFIQNIIYNMFPKYSSAAKHIKNKKDLLQKRKELLSSEQEIIDEVNQKVFKKIVLEKREEIKKLNETLHKFVNERKKIQLSIEKSNQDIFILKEKLTKQQALLQEDLLKQTIETERHNNQYGSILFQEELKEFVDLRNIFDDIKNLHEKNNLLDNKQRTDNFYYALHLLEAFFFLSQIIDETKKLDSGCLCIYCKEDKFKWNPSFSKIQCNTCKIEYIKDAPYHKNNGLTDIEVTYIIQNGGAFVRDRFYSIKINHDVNGRNYLNIQGSEDGEHASEIFFNRIFPIFPIITTTCNSLGSITRTKNNAAPKNIFDFLLIDEAGTIIPSKNIVINSAKRVMLFGDLLQLKPVFPYTKRTEEKILSQFFTNEIDIRKANEYFSCAAKDNSTHEDYVKMKISNNAMSIANNATEIFLPYVTSKLEGDIWLKEHYRCGNSIAKIANSLTYNDEMILENKNKGFLQFIQASGSKDQNNTNKEEALDIIKYIIENQTFLCNLCSISPEKYFNNIGIITPFTNQQTLIEDNLNQSDIKGVKVGTVHKYQGSAKDIILFSTVYNKEAQGKTKNMFFNRDETDMINVAVTRAKKVFIVFGDKEALTTNESFYSGLMMNHIESFKEEASHPI